MGSAENFNCEWRRCGNGNKKLKVWYVDVDGGSGPREGDNVKIMVGRVPTSYYGDEDPVDLCQDWIKRSALRGKRGFQEELTKLST